LETAKSPPPLLPSYFCLAVHVQSACNGFAFRFTPALLKIVVIIILNSQFYISITIITIFTCMRPLGTLVKNFVKKFAVRRLAGHVLCCAAILLDSAVEDWLPSS
jgi:hypothetical protein